MTGTWLGWAWLAKAHSPLAPFACRFAFRQTRRLDLAVAGVLPPTRMFRVVKL